jgi:hypothetical protein
VELSPGALHSRLLAYKSRGEDTVEFYAAETTINGLIVDAVEKRLDVETFTLFLAQTVEQFKTPPRKQESGDTWDQIAWTTADLLPCLAEAAAQDSQ